MARLECALSSHTSWRGWSALFLDYTWYGHLARSLTFCRRFLNSTHRHESFIMDCADPHYLQLLKEEAERHVAMLGDDFSGVSCDRGWGQLFNPFADDGVSFCDGGQAGEQAGGGQPGRCRSLLFSLQVASAVVFDVFHRAGKLVS